MKNIYYDWTYIHNTYIHTYIHNTYTIFEYFVQNCSCSDLNLRSWRIKQIWLYTLVFPNCINNVLKSSSYKDTKSHAGHQLHLLRHILALVFSLTHNNMYVNPTLHHPLNSLTMDGPIHHAIIYSKCALRQVRVWRSCWYRNCSAATC